MFKSKTSTGLSFSVGSNDQLTVNGMGDIVVNNSRISSPDPLHPSHLTTKSYVDKVALGLDPRAACRVLVTSNIDLNTPPSIIDGITLKENDRVLVIGQTDKTQNGIYVLKSGKFIRSEDANANDDFVKPIHTFISSGTLHAKTGWILLTSNVILGTSDIIFTPFADSSDILVGNGLRVNGSIVEVISENPETIVSTQNGLNLYDLWSDSIPDIESNVYNVVQVDKFGRVIGVSMTDVVSEIVAGYGIAVSGNEIKVVPADNSTMVADIHGLNLKDIWSDKVAAVETKTYNTFKIDKYGRVIDASMNDPVLNEHILQTASPATGSVIDVTKTIASLGSGSYTLPDGVEGQIIYIVANYVNSTDPVVIVSNARATTLQQNYVWRPLQNASKNFAIFTNGAWSV